MDDEKLKYQIGANIAACRKGIGMTQAELAEKLNYSDKAVSKWERGESTPDVLTLMQLAKLFGVTIDALVSFDCPHSEAAEPAEPPKKQRINRRALCTLSSMPVWGVALLTYVVFSSVGLPNSWVAFFYAVPVNAIVLLSLRSAWRDFRWNPLLISIIVWGCLASIYVSILVFLHQNVWKLFLLGIPGQAAIWLWFRLFRHEGKEESHG